MSGAFSRTGKSWAYRYNQPNPTSGSHAVGHAAENWMMFVGSNTGSVSFTPISIVVLSTVSQKVQWLSDVHSDDPGRNRVRRRINRVLVILCQGKRSKYFQTLPIACVDRRDVAEPPYCFAAGSSKYDD